MPYLLTQIFLCLLAAFLLGLLFGWLIFRNRGGGRVASLEADLDACRKGRKACDGEIDTLKARIAKLESARAGVGGAAPVTASGGAATASGGAAPATALGGAAPVTASGGAAPAAPSGGAAPVAATGGAVATPLMAGIPAATGAPDDLKRIWGIGPRMESLLNGSGITTFEQLRTMRVERLREIIQSWGSKRLSDLSNEETWPDQASMAAKGDWNALSAYQEKLSWRDGGGKAKP